MVLAQWEQALDLVKGGCGGTPCPLPDFDAPGWTEVLAQTRVRDRGRPRRRREPGDGFEDRPLPARYELPALQYPRNILAALDAIAAEMRAAGTCAWQHSDAIMARRPDANWEELHAMAFGNGCLLAPSNAYKRTFREP